MGKAYKTCTVTILIPNQFDSFKDDSRGHLYSTKAGELKTTSDKHLPGAYSVPGPTTRGELSL